MAVILDVKEARAANKVDNAGDNDQDQDDPNAEKKREVMQEPSETGNAKRNWRKLFAVRKFLSLAKYQSQAAPAQLLVANR